MELFGMGSRGFGTTWGSTRKRRLDERYPETAAAVSYAGRGPKSYQRPDDRICEDICMRLTDHPDIDATEVEVRVDRGEVTLAGTVDSRSTKRLAEDIADSVYGVRDIHNQLRVTQPDPAPRA